MTASRRAMLALPAAVAACGAVAVGATHPDAYILELCEEWHRAFAETKRLDAVCIAKPNDGAAEDAWRLSLDVTDALERRLLPLRPRTPAGLAAKAGVFHLAIEDTRNPGDELNWDEELSQTIVADVVALYGMAASPA